MAGDKPMIWVKREVEYFARNGWTGVKWFDRPRFLVRTETSSSSFRGTILRQLRLVMNGF
jgi:hypothetical protein